MTDSVTLSRSLPTIGFGVYQFEPSLCPDAVESALKVGHRHVNSAQYYENEVEVGQSAHKFGIPHEQVFITSKVYATPGYDGVLRLVEGSVGPRNPLYRTKCGNVDLQKLGYYDLFLVHSPCGGRAARLERCKALLEAKKCGQIRTVGVSNFSEKYIREILEEGLEKPAVNQIERPIVSYCKSEGIVMQAYSPLVRGNKAVKGKGIKNVIVLNITTKVLIRWSLQKGFVPLPKATSTHQIEVFDFALDTEDMTELDALDEGGSGAVSR